MNSFGSGKKTRLSRVYFVWTIRDFGSAECQLALDASQRCEHELTGQGFTPSCKLSKWKTKRAGSKSTST